MTLLVSCDNIWAMQANGVEEEASKVPQNSLLCETRKVPLGFLITPLVIGHRRSFGYASNFEAGDGALGASICQN